MSDEQITVKDIMRAVPCSVDRSRLRGEQPKSQRAPMLTIPDVAKDLGISVDAARPLIEQMRHFRAGKMRRVSVEDFAQWKADGGREAWITYLCRSALPIHQHAVGAVVYFIGQGSRFVKIGTTASLQSRLHSLRCASPVELDLLALFPGGAQREGEFHKRFASVRHRGEWFRRRGDLAKLLERLVQK